MLEAIRRVGVSVLRRVMFWRDASPIVPAAVEPEKMPREDKQDAIDAAEASGQFYYFGDLLDRLDGYFESLSTLRKYDREAYLGHARMGGYIFNIPKRDLSQHDVSARIDARFMDPASRPAFGMVSFMMDAPEDDKMGLSLAYFERIRFCPETELPTGTLYRVGCVYRDSNGADESMGWFAVDVTPDGTIRCLKQRMGWNGGIEQATAWKLPSFLGMIESGGQNGRVSKQKAGAALFALVFNGWSSCNTGLHVNIRKGPMASVFCIDMLRTPYFFKDREKVADKNGRAKKIFHIVRTHKRRNSDGSESFVKSHFRGLRRFMWNGYEVLITMPGKHGNHIEQLTCAGIDPKDPVIRGKKTYRLGTVGTLIRRSVWEEAA